MEDESNKKITVSLLGDVIVRPPVTQGRMGKQLLALLILARRLPEFQKNGEVSRNWLAENLYPEEYARDRGYARDLLRHVADGFAIELRNKLESARDYLVLPAGEVNADIDDFYYAFAQQEYQRMADLWRGSLLEGWTHSWQQSEWYKTIRRDLDCIYLKALYQLADRELSKRQEARSAGYSVEKVEEYRQSALKLLSRAIEHMKLALWEDVESGSISMIAKNIERLHDDLQVATSPSFPGTIGSVPPRQGGRSARAASRSFPGTIGSAPPPPALFIGREDELRDIKLHLRINEPANIPNRVQVLTAVRGWPGVGKTTLTAAIAHDPDIIAAFPDGILWKSLGQAPNILSELTTWGRELGNDRIGNSQSIAEASESLRALLQKQRMLLIVDDVWETEHARPFIVGGTGCAMLITTRDSEVARDLAPMPQDVYVLRVLIDEHAFELLQILAPTVVAQYPEQCRELVHALEGLPLALQVAGRLLNAEADHGWRIDNLLKELRSGAEMLGLKVPADCAELVKETTPTIAILLQKSTDRLDPQTRDCFALLGAFAPKPATFDIDALDAVWKDVSDYRSILNTLLDRGLLERFEADCFQMHALLVIHARSLLG